MCETRQADPNDIHVAALNRQEFKIVCEYFVPVSSPTHSSWSPNKEIKEPFVIFQDIDK